MEPIDSTWLIQLLVALGVGALIGLERQHSTSAGRFAGVRTCALVALLGGLIQLFFSNLLPIAFILILVLVGIGYTSKILIETDVGMTTSVAVVLTFVFGAMATHSSQGLTLSIILGTLTMALLSQKSRARALTDRIGEEELHATIKFLIIALVVLPLLPDRSIDVLLGLNPRFVWLMVVFVSGLSFLGYVLTKTVGPEKGIGITGLVGGFVSSTATAMAMAEHAKRYPELTHICAFATVVASIAMFPRVLILISVINLDLLIPLLLPLVMMTLTGLIISGLLVMRFRSGSPPPIEFDNPFRIKPALAFGLLFAVVILLLEWLSAQLGDAGVYGTAVLSGTVDANAITLSLARLADVGDLSSSVAVTGIVLAVVVNTLVKIGISWAMGTHALGRLVAVVLGMIAVVGVGIVLVF